VRAQHAQTVMIAGRWDGRDLASTHACLSSLHTRLSTRHSSLVHTPHRLMASTSAAAAFYADFQRLKAGTYKPHIISVAGRRR